MFRLRSTVPLGKLLRDYSGSRPKNSLTRCEDAAKTNQRFSPHFRPATSVSLGMNLNLPEIPVWFHSAPEQCARSPFSSRIPDFRTDS